MANINEAFPSQYLKASDLKGQQPVVVIDRVEFEPVGRDKEMKPILYFVGKEKGFVLNRTNSKTIINLTSSAETDDWSGFRIKLFATHVEFAGESVEAIRIKAAPANATPVVRKPVEPEPVEDIDDSSIPF